jgi:hypothetical protein
MNTTSPDLGKYQEQLRSINLLGLTSRPVSVRPSYSAPAPAARPSDLAPAARPSDLAPAPVPAPRPLDMVPISSPSDLAPIDPTERLAGKKRTHEEATDYTALTDNISNMVNTYMTKRFKSIEEENKLLKDRISYHQQTVVNIRTDKDAVLKENTVLKERNAQLEGQLAAIRSALQGK